MATGPLGEESKAESGDGGKGGLGWCDVHQTRHLKHETRIVPADVDGVPVSVTEDLHWPAKPPTGDDPPTDSLTYNPSAQETVIVGGGFMFLDVEPLITPYERQQPVDHRPGEDLDNWFKDLKG